MPSPALFHDVLAARDGLLLVLTTIGGEEDELLHVFCPATGRRMQIVPDPPFDGQYILLVGGDDNNGGGDGAFGRFRVVKVKSTSWNGKRHDIQFQTFSSEHGGWGQSVKVRIPYKHGALLRAEPLVSNGALHWLCRSDKLYYILKLHVDSAQVTTMKLPASFHHEYGRVGAARKQLLLATTTSEGGIPRLCVFAAEMTKISVWAQSERDSSMWTRQPQMEIEHNDTWVGTEGLISQERIRLEWFSDRSGFVLFNAPGHGFFMMDVRSKKLSHGLRVTVIGIA